MADEGIAILRKSAEALNRGDWEAVIRMMDPEVTFIPLRAPVQGSYVGHEGLARFAADTRETFELFEWHEDEIQVIGDQVLALGRLRIRGRGSHIETEVPSPIVARIENGLITYFHTLPDVDAALAEANEELVRLTLTTFPTDEEAWLATLDPEFVWHPIEEGHSPSVGHEAARRIRARWFESFEGHQVEIEQIAGEGDNVVSSIHITGTGRASGVAVDIWIHMQWKVRDGLIYYMYEHADREAALAAAGLSG